MAHLWEADHQYYCNDGNYCAAGHFHQYKRWADFISEFGDSDMDYNMVFRWDWREGDDWGAGEFAGDVNYRNGLLKIYMMQQRKGLFTAHEVEVCRADEPAVIAFLSPRLAYLLSLWAPLPTATSATPADGRGE